jgi:hypothetical protein
MNRECNFLQGGFAFVQVTALQRLVGLQETAFSTRMIAGDRILGASGAARLVSRCPPCQTRSLVAHSA